MLDWDAYIKPFKMLMPKERFGSYSIPGWLGNGLSRFPNGEAAGVELDPIAAEANLFFKGFLLLVMGIHAHVSGDDKYFQEWPMAGVGGTSRTWTVPAVAGHLEAQWSQRECGLH